MRVLVIEIPELIENLPRSLPDISEVRLEVFHMDGPGQRRSMHFQRHQFHVASYETNVRITGEQ